MLNLEERDQRIYEILSVIIGRTEMVGLIRFDFKLFFRYPSAKSIFNFG